MALIVARATAKYAYVSKNPHFKVKYLAGGRSVSNEQPAGVRDFIAAPQSYVTCFVFNGAHLKKMPLSAAEKQKRYRERLKNKPECYEEAKKKQRERYHKTKRLVKDLTPKEKYNANTIWRLRKREQAKKKRIVERVLQNTPPSSPQPEYRFQHIQNDPQSPTPPPTTPPPVTPALGILPPATSPLPSNPLQTLQPVAASPQSQVAMLPQVTSLPAATLLESVTTSPTTSPLTTQRSLSATHSSLTLSSVTPPSVQPFPAIPPSISRPPPVSSSPPTISSRPANPVAFIKPVAQHLQPLSSAFVNLKANPQIESPKQRGRKKIRRDRAKVCRENRILAEKNENLKKTCEKYKKKYLREKNKPKSKLTNNDLKYTVLADAIKETFKKTKSKKERNTIKQIFAAAAIKNSRMKINFLLETFGTNKIEMNKSHFDRQTLLKKKIKEFFLRDDITRASAGKKEVLTKKGITVPKRYMLDTMKNLHKVFLKESPEIKCSYYYFTRNKPFFVVTPSIDAREMCLCKLHANFEYKAKALRKKGITGTDDPSLLIEATVCDVNSKDCMHGLCNECKNKKSLYNVDKINGVIKWTEWTRKEEKYQKDGKMIKAIRNIREELSEYATDFMKRFEKDLAVFRKHIFNIKCQFRNFRQCLQNIRPSECLIVVDFSENYNCKYHKEIQHHHFGGSRNQISLHTVVVYTFNDKIGAGYEVHSFCTVSASNIHQPAAIWAHLDPIITSIRSQFVSIKTVHFFSDGPSTQYRQKQNFYLMCTKLFDYGFERMTWSFFEAGHGKGPADGIGGFLKITADKIVAKGEDIADVFQFYNKMKDVSKIKIFLIDETKIIDEEKALPCNIPRLLGTLKVHQVFSTCRGMLHHRELSCFCEESSTENRGFCMCFEPNLYDVSNIIVDKENRATDVPISDLAESSDDDVPLQTLILSKTLQDITNKGQGVYRDIYSSSSDDEHPCTSYDNSKIGNGDYLLVNVYVDVSKTKVNTYKYACKALSDIEDDGEIKVMFMRVVDKCAKRFRLDEKDVSYIDYQDIIERLPNPEIVKKGHRIYYDFKTSINVFEK